jgi:hypothetical protein
MIRPTVAVIASVPLALASAACDGGPSIRPIEGAPAVQRGELTTRPIVFATDDYFIRPATTDAEEGWLRVPENRRRPTGRRLQIHFVRFPSRAAHPSHPVVYLAGGPGGSGTYSAAGDRFPLFMHLRRAGDVIALDQRGVAFTTPRPVCPGGWSYPLDRPLDERTLAAAVVPWLRRCAAYWKDSVDLSAFNARESADDLEDLRRALGSEKLSLGDQLRHAPRARVHPAPSAPRASRDPRRRRGTGSHLEAPLQRRARAAADGQRGSG